MRLAVFSLRKLNARIAVDLWLQKLDLQAATQGIQRRFRVAKYTKLKIFMTCTVVLENLVPAHHQVKMIPDKDGAESHWISVACSPLDGNPDVWITLASFICMGPKAAIKPTPVSSPATLHEFPADQAAQSQALCPWHYVTFRKI